MRQAGLTLSALLAVTPLLMAQQPVPGTPNNPRIPTPGSGAAPGVNPGGVPIALTGGNQGPAGNPAGNAPAPAALDPRLEAHLRAWQARSQGIQNLYTECERTTKQTLLRKERTATGSIICMKPNLARMRMDFKDKPGEYEAYICDGKMVFQYDGAEKTMTPHQIPPGGNGGVGDNLLIEFMSGNMTADDVKRRFTLKLSKEEEYYVHIEITPRLPKDKEEFESLLLVLYGPRAAAQKWDYLPAVVKMTKDNGQTVEQWTFKNPMANVQGIETKSFAYVEPPKDWTKKPIQSVDGGAPSSPRIARPMAPNK